MGLRIDSKVEGVTGSDPNSFMTYAQVQQLIAAIPGGGAAAGVVTGRQLLNPQYGDKVHPAANVNGPIVTNNPMTTVQPNVTGMIFIPWDKLDETGKSVFNRQGQNWEAAASVWSPSQSACLNVTTNRSGGYLGQTQSVGGMEVDFVTQSKRVIAQCQISGPSLNTSGFDATYLIEGNGDMARTQAFPESVNNSTATAPYYKEHVTSETRRTVHHRYLMPGHTVFHGVWIEQGCDIYAGPNCPLIPFDGDSWMEAFTAGTWVQGAGTDLVFGSYFSQTIGWWIAQLTGWKGAWVGEGGTGVDNAGVGNGSSKFLSVGRNTYFAQKFAAQKPLAYCLFGSANDGYHNGPQGLTAAQYRDAILTGIADLRSRCADPTLSFILNGPQSLSDPLTNFPNGPQTAHRLGCIQAAQQGTNIQFFDQIDYTYGPFGGKNGDTPTSSWSFLNADLLHGNVSGQKYVAHRYVDDMCKLLFSVDRLTACLAWSG